jgi:putative copper resistance protein D
MFTTASMTGRLAGAGDPTALVLVLGATEFGRVWLLRLVLLAALIVLLAIGRAAPAVSMLEIILAALVVASLAWVGHGGEGQGSGTVLHRLADAVHLLAGSLWIGALVALVLLHRVARSTADEARVLATALLRFSAIGPAVVVLLIFTGLINSWFLVGPEHALSLAASSYGLVLAAKIFLFAAMLLLAGVNRYWLTPQLSAALWRRQPGTTIRALRLSLIAETGLGFAVLAAVAALGTLAPPHTI